MPSLDLPPLSLVRQARLAQTVLDLEDVINDLSLVAACLRHDLADMATPAVESWPYGEETTAALTGEISRLRIEETNDVAPLLGHNIAVTEYPSGVAFRYENRSYAEFQKDTLDADMSEFAKRANSVTEGNSLVKFTQDDDKMETVAFREITQRGAPRRVSSSCGGSPFRRRSAVELEDIFWDKKPWRGRSCPLPKRKREDDTDEIVTSFTNRRRTN